MPDILVTIPAYNEGKTIGNVVRNIRRVLDGQDYQINVVSDGSDDDTEQEAVKAGAVVYKKRHSGLADTFRYEMELARRCQPDIIIHTDADGQYVARDMLKLLRAVRNGSDLVLGSRLRGRIQNMPKSKRSTNVLATVIMRYWLRADITDATTGFRAFNIDIACLPIRSDYTYTVEQIIRAKRAGYKIKSVPINFLVRDDGESRLMSNPIHYIWRTLLNTKRMLQ